MPRDDRTDEFDATDLPPLTTSEEAAPPGQRRPSFADDDEHTQAFDPTEMMDRQTFQRAVRPRLDTPVPPSDRTMFGAPTTDEADGPTEDGEASLSIPTPNETYSPETYRPEATNVDANPDVTIVPVTGRYGTRDGLFADTGEHTRPMIELPKRPPAPPPSKRPAPPPARRPAGFSKSSADSAPPPSAHTALSPNPFMPPPSKFFQSSGPGRSKPRESTIDIDPDDLPPVAPPPPRPPQQSEASISVVEDLSSIELQLQRLPGATPPSPSSPPPPPAAPPLPPPQPSFTALPTAQKAPPLPSRAAATSAPPPPLPSAAAPAPRAVEPVLEVEFDYELEARLREREDWHRLVELYTSSAVRSDSERREHLQQAADILHHQLGELERAFSTHVDVLEQYPDSAESAAALEKIAAELGVHGKARWADAVRRIKKVEGQTGDVERRVAYLALLFRWNNNELRRRDVAAEVFTRLSELSPRHPTVLERRANEARARGDAQQQRQLLTEALPLLTRTDDQIRVHLALAELYEGPLALRANALPHYEAVLELEPKHFDALRGLERALRDGNDPDRLRDVLERMVAAATTPKERLDPLIRLAETLEKELFNPEAAAEILEDALAIDQENAKALAALERCREALGHWSDVARVMQRRAAVLTAPRAKLDLLFASADVLEKRAQDLPGALEAYRMVMALDGKNRRALGEMRRLAEEMSDWDEVVSLSVRLAEVTPDKRESARLYAELGELLEERGEPHLARAQFERALELDKRNRAVHSALERLARAAGQDERARHFLEQRAKLTDDKAQAAELYAQLGRERRDAGDDAGALEAFSAAHHANPELEEPASVLLDWHVAQGNFRAVEPLLEPLTAASRRDGDQTRTLHLLRLATRTAASLGKLEAALHAAMAAFDEAPDDAGARSDLLEVAARTAPERLVVARDHLARIASSLDDMNTAAIVTLAEAQYAAGDARRAIATLEQAHDLSPTDPLPLEALEPILESEQQWERLAATKVERARMLPLAEEELHFRLLADAGDLWARRLRDVRAASEAFEEARVLRPDDGWLLDTLAWAYREIEEWQKLAEVLDTLAAAAETPNKERELLLELAALQAKELADPEAAAGTLNRVLDSDPQHLQAFEDLVRLLTDQRNWAALERSYRKMLQRVQGQGARPLELALWKQLGLVYRDRLGNNPSALESFQAALAIEPADEELHRIVVELNLLLGDLDGAIAQARKRVQYAPFEPETYATLYDLFLRRSSYDLAWCALDVMAQLVPLEGEEEQLYLGYPPYPLDEIPGTLTEEAWQTHLLDSEMDATLTSLFAWATPAEVRLLERASTYTGLHPFDMSQSDGSPSLTAIIENGAEILGMINPALYHADRADMPLRPAASPMGAFLVDPQLAYQEQETLSFHVGRGLSWLRSELMPLAFFPTTADLSGFLARLVRQDPDLYFAMTEDERQTVTSIIDQAAAEGAKFDVKRWLVLAHASSARAAVLLAGTVHEAAVFYSRAEDDENASEKLTALYQFAVSDEHTELRTAIGIAITPPT